jgi:predicted DNA-binding transcriptional regulator AlpA
MTRLPQTDAPTSQTGSPEDAQALRRLALRLNDVAAALGVSRRAIERERSAGRFPKPDVTIGRMPLWTPETLARWVENGGGR